MKAIQMAQQGGPEVLRLVELPDPQPGPGEVVIKVDAAGVNFSDLMRRRGDVYPVATPLPFVPGAEVAGTIVALGQGVDGPAIGTQVCGLVGADGSGGYAEYARAYAQSLIPIPEGLNSDAAAGVVFAGLTAAVMLNNVAQISGGETVFVPAAAGGVGSYAVQIAKLLGARTVIGGAGTPSKREIALTLGADHAVDYREHGWTKRVLELTDGNGVDVALEMHGPDHLGQTLRILAPFGRLISYGWAAGPVTGLDPDALIPFLYNPAPSQFLTGFNVGIWLERRSAETVASLRRLVGWIASGQLRVPTIYPMPLAEAAEAHRLMETSATTGKVVLKP